MKKGIVYKIELDNEMYIGSTEQQLCDRQRGHNSDMKNSPHRKLYKKCIEQEIETIKCIWVADIEFNSTAEKRAIEEKYRKELNATLNSQRCYTTKKERREDQNANNKIYIEKNKEKLSQYRKKYREKNKDRIAEYQKKYNKEYAEKNKEKITEKNKKYYENNKEKEKERGKIYREKMRENKDKIT